MLPVICEHVELEGPHGNDLLHFWEAQAFPWTPSAMLYWPPQSIFMVVNPSHLPGVLILKPEPHHSARLTVACMQASSWLGNAD